MILIKFIKFNNNKNMLLSISLLVIILLLNNICICNSNSNSNSNDNTITKSFNTLIDSNSNGNDILKRYKITTIDNYDNIDKDLDDICNLCINVFFNDDNKYSNNFFFKTITLNILKRLVHYH